MSTQPTLVLDNLRAQVDAIRLNLIRKGFVHKCSDAECAACGRECVVRAAGEQEQ